MFFRQKTLVVPSLLIINGLVFLMWNLTETKLFMPVHFLTSYHHLSLGLYHTLLTSAFSHNMLMHFFLNMFVLQSFGPFLETYLGSIRFLILYLIFGVTGSLAHCLTSHFILQDSSQAALGASGAIAGVILLFSLSFPKEKILLLGIIPLPAIFGALAFIGLDLWGLYAQSSGGGLPIGHGAHLGGALAGAVLHFLYIKGYRKRMRRGF